MDAKLPDGDARVPSPVITASGVSYDYGARRALDGASLALGAGEMVALIGPNGAGKTTLLSVLAGVLSPATGSVSARGRVGWVPQRSASTPVCRWRRTCASSPASRASATWTARVAAMVAQMGLSERAGEPVGRLSGGNRQRVNVAIGLLGAPAVLLLDEPTSALDPAQRERLWAFIAALSTPAQPCCSPPMTWTRRAGTPTACSR